MTYSRHGRKTTKSECFWLDGNLIFVLFWYRLEKRSAKKRKKVLLRNSPHVCAREEKENNSFNDLILDAPTRRRAHSMPAPSIVRVTFDDSLGNATPPLRPFSYTQTRYYISSIFISLIVSIPVV